MTAAQRYRVVLTEEDIEEIKRKLRSKSTPKTIIRRCRILLDLDEAHGKVLTREQCAKRNGVCVTTVVHTASNFSEHGLKEALSSKRSVNSDNAHRKLDGRAEAKIIEIATSPAQEGHARWTLRLLEKERRVAFETPVAGLQQLNAKFNFDSVFVGNSHDLDHRRGYLALFFKR